MLGCLSIFVFTIFATSAVELVRILWRIVRQKQLGNRAVIVVHDAMTESQDAATTLHSIISAIAKSQKLRSDLQTAVYDHCPPRYPELMLMANTLRSLNKANNALENLLTCIQPSPKANANTTTVTYAAGAEPTGATTVIVPNTSKSDSAI